MDVLLIGNDQVLKVLGVQDAITEAYINDATVTARIKLRGNEVDGQSWPLTLSYVAASNGNYQGLLQDTIDLQPDRPYTIEIRIEGSGGLVGFYRYTRAAVYRTPDL